jgi:hypothetical protein
MMNQSIYSRCGGHRVFEELLLYRKGQVAGDYDATAFIAICQKGKQHFHLLTVLLNVSDVVDDHRIKTRQFLRCFVRVSSFLAIKKS